MTVPRNNEGVVRFGLAGVSCMAAAVVTNPLDVIKIRMQIDNELSGKKGTRGLSERYYKGVVRGLYRLVHEEGISSIFRGVTASVLREGVYSTIRLGAYEQMKSLLGATSPSHTPLWKKVCAGAITGAVGSSIATPTDVVKIRFQAHRHGAATPYAFYSNTFSAFRDIYRRSGLAGLYVGMGPTVQRATILNATQIPAYDHVKHTLLNLGLMQEGVRLHVIASMTASFFTALTTSPIDVIKTRIMKQDGKNTVYSSARDCFVKTLRSEGALGFYKGFLPNYMRIGPHTIITFLIFEHLRKLMGIAPV